MLRPSLARLIPLTAIVALIALSTPTPAHGASFTVNATHDAVDAAPGDGLCADSTGACTLRAAVMETNALAGADEITLPALGVPMFPVPSYTLGIAGVAEDAAATGDLDITESLAINGGGSAVTIIDGADIDRVIQALPGADLALNNVTVRNGNTTNDGGGILAGGALTINYSTVESNQGNRGGGIAGPNITLNNSGVFVNTAAVGGGTYNESLSTLSIIDSSISANTALTDGGGIYNGGTLEASNLTITGNTAATGGGLYVRISPAGNPSPAIATMAGSTVRGNAGDTAGGIFNGGILLVDTSTIEDNEATSGGGGIFNSNNLTITHSAISGNTAGFDGGGLNNNPPPGSFANPIITMTNSTVSGNTAGIGGGIHSAVNIGNATVALTNVTIADNTATFNGGGIVNGVYSTTTLYNTIIATSTGSNCSAFQPITSLGHNLDSDGTCGLTGPGDISPVDPKLGLLADNGGFTKTHALLAGSPAIDAGDNAACPTTDQRSILRPLDGNGDGVPVCDVGAFEADAIPVTPAPEPTPTLAPILLPRTGGIPGEPNPQPVAVALVLPAVALGMAFARRLFTHR